jgi:hypothetical protein
MGTDPMFINQLFCFGAHAGFLVSELGQFSPPETAISTSLPLNYRSGFVSTAPLAPGSLEVIHNPNGFCSENT